MTVPYTQRGFIKFSRGDEDEDSNSDHLRHKTWTTILKLLNFFLKLTHDTYTETATGFHCTVTIRMRNISYRGKSFTVKLSPDVHLTRRMLIFRRIAGFIG